MANVVSQREHVETLGLGLPARCEPLTLPAAYSSIMRSV